MGDPSSVCPSINKATNQTKTKHEWHKTVRQTRSSSSSSSSPQRPKDRVNANRGERSTKTKPTNRGEEDHLPDETNEKSILDRNGSRGGSGGVRAKPTTHGQPTNRPTEWEGVLNNFMTLNINEPMLIPGQVCVKSLRLQWNTNQRGSIFISEN